MVLQVKAVVTKSNNLSLIFGAHMAKGRNWVPQDLHICDMHTDTYTYTKKKKYIKELNN